MVNISLPRKIRRKCIFGDFFHFKIFVRVIFVKFVIYFQLQINRCMREWSFHVFRPKKQPESIREYEVHTLNFEIYKRVMGSSFWLCFNDAKNKCMVYKKSHSNAPNRNRSNLGLPGRNTLSLFVGNANGFLRTTVVLHLTRFENDFFLQKTEQNID